MTTQAPSQILPLKDIHLPDAPGFWPLAPGWWILLLLVIIVLVTVFYFGKTYLHQRRQKKLLSHRLLTEFKQIQLAYKTHKNQHQLACDMSAFLRRIALHELKATDSVSLSGEEWLVGLSYLSDVDLSAHRQALTEAPYNPNVQFDVLALVNAVEQLCRNVINKQVKQSKSATKPQAKSANKASTNQLNNEVNHV